MKAPVFVDTETLGLLPEIHPVWEIAVLVDGLEHVWQVEVSEGEASMADRTALRINGFFERYDPAKAMPRTQSIKLFGSLTADRSLAGMVPSFDEERLRREWTRRVGAPQPWDHHLVDVRVLAFGWLLARGCQPKDPWDTAELVELLGIDPPSDRHTALGDARFARSVYERLVE